MTGQNFMRRSIQMELMDNLNLQGDASRKNMQELEAVNFWLGGKNTLISALNIIYRKHLRLFKNKKTVIADLGCGGGDLLRATHKWAKKEGLNVNLIGVDANRFTAQYAAKNSAGFNNIRIETLNVFSDELKTMRFDVVCLNTLCHHLGDPDLITLLKQLKEQTSTAIIINDLHRHWFAYLSIKWLSRLLNFSYLSRHDGPISVLRAFRKHELVDLLKLADIACYQIRWRWAFRWEVVIWTQ
jgi:2-polyprenyl-3-methyl-5-hydroxy-6-metoxy-1,4-benzoquinol methylase